MALFAAEGPNGAWLPADILEFYWSAGAFLIVMALLVWKVLPTVKAGMSSRSERIKDELVEAERARVDAETELSALRSKLGSAEDEQARIASEAQDTARRVKAELMARADEDAELAKSKAHAELSASSGQATADIQAIVAGQATAATESVVMSNLDSQTHDDLINRYIEEVRGS